MNDSKTDPPPAPDSKALRAIGRELDTIGDALGEMAAHVGALTDMGEEDARTLTRVEEKIDKLITLLTGPEAGLLRRTSELESWRREHEQDHARLQ
jgi:hypothetical protein